ncbi:MAG: hypothetical protein R3B49_04480 [Phycisphaerales bacterium]
MPDETDAGLPTEPTPTEDPTRNGNAVVDLDIERELKDSPPTP